MRESKKSEGGGGLLKPPTDRIGLKVAYNIPSFGELLRKHVYSFRNILESSENSIVRGIYLSQFLLQSGIWVWWRDILSP